MNSYDEWIEDWDMNDQDREKELENMSEREYHLLTCDEDTEDCVVKMEERKKGNWLYQEELKK